MKKLWLALPILALAPALFAQDRPKEEVESPLKRTIAAAPVQSFDSHPASLAQDKFDLSRSGIEWKKGLDAALNQGKPVLLFQLLGNFDDVYC